LTSLPPDVTREEVGRFFSGNYNLNKPSTYYYPLGLSPEGIRKVSGTLGLTGYALGVISFDAGNDTSLASKVIEMICLEEGCKPSPLVTSLLSYFLVVVAGVVSYLFPSWFAKWRGLGEELIRKTPWEIFNAEGVGGVGGVVNAMKTGGGGVRKKSSKNSSNKVYIVNDGNEDNTDSDQITTTAAADAAWTQYYDEVSSSYYYYNPISQDSSWEPPLCFKPVGDVGLPTLREEEGEEETAGGGGRGDMSLPMPVHVTVERFGEGGVRRSQGQTSGRGSRRLSVMLESSPSGEDETIRGQSSSATTNSEHSPPPPYAFEFNGQWITEIILIRPLSDLIRRFRQHEKLLDEIANAWDGVNKYRTILLDSKEGEVSKGEKLRLENLQRKKQFAMKTLQKLKKRLEDLNWSICGNVNPNDLNCTVGAFVTFEHQSSRERCLADYRVSTWWIGKRFQPESLQFVNEREIDPSTGKHKLYTLTVTKAPPPGGVLWENLEHSYGKKLRSRGRTTVATLGFLLLSFVSIYLAYSFKASRLESIPDLGRCEVFPSVFYGTYRIPSPVGDGVDVRPGEYNYPERNEVSLTRDRTQTCQEEGEFYVTYTTSSGGRESIDYDNLPSLIVPSGDSYSTLAREEFVCSDEACEEVNTLPLIECDNPCQPIGGSDYCPTPARGIPEWRLDENGGHKCETYRRGLLAACYCYERMVDVMREDSWGAWGQLREEESDMCGSIFWEYLYAGMSASFASFSILLINIILGILINKMVVGELHSSYSGQARAAFVKISVAQFLNTAVTTVVANAYIEYEGGVRDFLDSIDFYTGTHKDFTKSWYVGGEGRTD